MIVKEGSSGNFKLPPAEMVQAVCFAHADLGLFKNERFGKIQQKLIILFEIDHRIDEGENAGKRFIVGKRYTASLSDKSYLRKDLESWRGKRFTPDELKGFNLDKLHGVNCMLNITHEEYNGKAFAQITTIVPPMQGMVPMIPETSAIPVWVEKMKEKSLKGTIDETQSPDEANSEEVPF